MTLDPLCHNAFKLWCKQPVGQLLKMSSEDYLVIQLGESTGEKTGMTTGGSLVQSGDRVTSTMMRVLIWCLELLARIRSSSAMRKCN